MSNKSDLLSINSYVSGRSAPPPGAPADVVRRWEALKTQWDNWFPGVASSWYVSDSDLAHAKSIRNSMMWNNDPKNWKDVSGGHAEDIATAMRDEPKKKGVPSLQKGLVPSRYMSKEGIKDLQRRINAAGYRPPLVVDGKYGKGTQAGERWLKARESGQNIPATKPDPAAQAVAMLGGPKPKPAEPAAPAPGKPTEKPAAPEPYRLLGVPVGIKSVVAAVAGTGAGWLAGGPVGAAIGIPVGWFGSKLIPEKKP